MLVLTRKLMQSIMIGDDIEVVVTEVKGDKVRLGIVAPHQVPVHRREVYEKIQRQKKAGVSHNGKLGAMTIELIDALVD